MDESLVREYPALEEGHFWWVSRRHFVHRLVGELLSIANLSILDVGCGNGVLAREFSAEGADVTALDTVSYPGWQTESGQKVDFVRGDYCEIGSSLGVFDLVTALDVMEHVEDDVVFAQTLYDNTKPEGMALVTVPAYQWLWSHHDVSNRHFRRYTEGALARTLGQVGFQVDRIGYIFFGLIVPAILRKFATRGKPGPAPSGLSWVNRSALSYFNAEHRLAASRRNFLPAGTSVIAICHRSR